MDGSQRTPQPSARNLAFGRHARADDWARAYARHIFVADLLCAVACGVIALLVSGAVPVRDSIRLPYSAILATTPLAWVAFIGVCHGYERRYLGVGPEEYRAVFSATVRLLAASAFVSYAVYVDRPILSRFFVLALFPLLCGASLLARFVFRRRLHRARLAGRAFHRAVVVGQNNAVLELVQDLQRESLHGLLPVAACTTEPGDLGYGLTRDGSVRDAIDVARACSADVVVVASPSGLDAIELRRLSWELDDLGTELIVAPGVVEVTGPRMSVRPAATLSLLHIERPALHGMSEVAKALFDRFVAGLFLVLLSPVFVVVALLIKIADGGPVFFRQERVGLGGRSFTMVKFRSMVPDAEGQLAEISGFENDGNGVLFKLRDDPCVTRVGKRLRRYSLDELPQMVNVLRGEMSIVGPRPPLPSEVERYGPDAVRRLRVKPGVTGLWQVSGRSTLSWDESLRLDLRYVDNWSIMLDLQILWRTARAVVRGTGAY